MRENRKSGSEGGETELNRSSLPLSVAPLSPHPLAPRPNPVLNSRLRRGTIAPGESILSRLLGKLESIHAGPGHPKRCGPQNVFGLEKRDFWGPIAVGCY